MIDSNLSRAVFALAEAAMDLSDADLERDYAWRYHAEGLRFSLIGAGHELRHLAADSAAARAAHGPLPTIAQRVLAQYHAAYRDLQAVLLGVGHAEAHREPAPGEWPLWMTLWHIIGADQSFFTRCRFAADQARAGAEPLVLSNAEKWDILAAEPATHPQIFTALIFGDSVRSAADLETAPEPEALSGSFAELLAYYDALHERVVRELGALTDAETLAPSLWWEAEHIPVRFRLHRFEAHLRQHVVQAEKTLAGLGMAPNEARLLLRQVYAALAEAEGALLGALPGGDAWDAAAAVIGARAAEIGQIA